MSGSTPSNHANFRIIIQKGATSGSTQPSPGGSGQWPARITATASASVTVEFTIEATGVPGIMRTMSTPLSQENTELHVLEPGAVNDYTLTAITTEPAPTDVTISGSVDYAQPVEK